MREHRQQEDKPDARRGEDPFVPGKPGVGTLGDGGLGGRGIVGSAEYHFAGDVQRHRDQQHHHNQRIGQRIIRNLGDLLEDLHRRDRVVIKDERRAQFGETPNERQGAAGEQPRPHQGQRDLAENHPPACPQVGRRLLHRGIGIGQRPLNIKQNDRV